jgi:hypothetical protein
MLPQRFHIPEFIHFRSKKDIPHLIFVLLLISGIILGVYLSLQPQLFSKKAAESGLVEIQFIPETLQVRSGQVYEAKIAINPKVERVTALQLELSYDPTVVTILDVKNEGFLPVTLKSQDNFDGTLNLVYGSTIETQSTKPGVVALIKFKVIDAKGGSIAIKSNSQVGVSSKEGNALSSFPALNLQSSATGTQTGTEDVRYPDSLLLEKAFHPEASPFVRDFKEASEPGPIYAPERVKPQLSGAYIKQLGKDIFIEPVVALNEVIQEKVGSIIKSE